MQLPLQITYRNVTKSESLDSEIRKRASQLDRCHDHIMSCRVAVEKPHRRDGADIGWRLRLDITLAGKGEIIVEKEAMPGQATNADLYDLTGAAFDVAERRLRKESERQRGQVKTPVADDVHGYIEKLFDDHGFLRNPGSDVDIYFHRNAVSGINFELLEVGLPVAYTLSGDGREGPQASSVRVPTGAGIGPRPTRRP